jgi:DNA-directed RNA polymerase subunit A'
VKNGPNNYPGANYVVRPDGARLKITEKNAEQLSERLAPGFIVERHLVDGDIVIFNRQPSLHRMSMMAHRVKVMPYHTFRLNLAVCPPYNADFDGDEMNLHVPQSEEAIAEAKILMLVQENMISPRFGGPVIGCLHDHISGAYLLTKGDAYFDMEECATMLGEMRYKGELPKPEIIDGKRCLSGKELFSLLLPKDLNLEFKSSICTNCEECKGEDCELDAYVVIRDGKLLHGVIDEKAIGVFKGVLIDKIARDYGMEAGRKFLDDVARLIVSAIMVKGFTIGLDDYDISEESTIHIKELLSEADDRLEGLIKAYESNELEPLPGRTVQETLEMEAMKVLGRTRDRAGEIAGGGLGLENSAVIMASSGARGSSLNLTQMAAMVGQQAVRGERISRGYHSRTLSHFKKGDLGSKAKGFVRSSFKGGMNLTEYFFHSMGGREGLVDTAVRTSHSGYLQRRMINAMIDLSVDQNLSVKDSAGNIIQLKYGEDGVDPTKAKNGLDSKIEELLAGIAGVGG